MKNIYCKIIEDGVYEFFQVISFLTVDQFSPYPARAVLVDMYGNVSTPAVQQITIVTKREVPEEYYDTAIDL